MFPAFFAAWIVAAPVPPVAPPPPPTAEAVALRARIAAFRQADSARAVALHRAKTPAEREAAERKYPQPDEAAFHAQVLRFLAERPTDPGGDDAYFWLRAHSGDPDKEEELLRVQKDILSHRGNNPNLAPLVQRLELWGAAGRVDRLFMEKAVESTDRAVRGSARFGLASALVDEADRLPDERAAERRPLEVTAAAGLRSVIAESADVPHYLGKPLGVVAERLLFELEHLSVGKEAPDVVGTDLNGAALKLSDFRGKVVLLIFWGSFYPAEVKENQELVATHAGKAVLLGVNEHDDRAKALATCAAKGITARSFGPGNKPGIEERWNVRSWPTIYLIDAKGVVRGKTPHLRSVGTGGRVLDRTLAGLVRELDAPGK